MSAQESPLAANQGAKDLAEGSKPSLGQIQHYPEVQQWNWNAAERDAYQYGYLLGHADGASAARAETTRLTWLVDLWYFCANNNGKRPGDYYTHQTDALWREASA